MRSGQGKEQTGRDAGHQGEVGSIYPNHSLKDIRRDAPRSRAPWRLLRRYAGLLWLQVRLSLLLGLQYRFDFLLEAVIEVSGAATSLVPLFVVYSGRDSV